MRTPEFWQQRGARALMLAPLGLLYGATVAWKARHASPFAVRARVICIGNLTAGGSGKTPVALAIGNRLQTRYDSIFFLTRGYGGREPGPLRVEPDGDAARFGDEALLLARMAPTIVARDRAAGAALAVAQGATAIVMDDGHQNFSLAKNLSIVVVDGEYAFGNGLMIPAGPLRETVPQGLARADAVIVMGDGSPDLHDYRGPVLRAKLVAEGEEFRGRHVFAFAGIGRPEKFVASLEKAGAIVTGTQFFADHHPYRDGEIAALKARAGDAQIVTTEKDLVRLSPRNRTGITALPVRAIFDDMALLDQLLGRIA
ncbi:MAG: tetraacyldisaccharide 4'-kinase [Pseudomonadota bacterium]